MVTHSAAPGGMNNVVRGLLEHAPEGTAAAWVFLEDGPVAARSPVPWAVIDAGRARHAWRAPRVVGSLRGAIRAHRADLVFAHVTKAHLYAAPAAALEDVPYLWWQHERVGQKPLMHELSGRLAAGAVICSAEHTAAEQRERWPGAPVRRVYPGAPATGATHCHVTATDPVFGVLGRLQRWKRVELALRAFPEVREQLPGARLQVIGGGFPGLDEDYPAELQALAGDGVEFLGEVEDGQAAIAGLDVLVHCAELEPFGLAPVEAMLASVPVIVPDEGGPRESVRDGVDGLRLDPCDTPALAAAMVRLGADPALRTEMGEAGLVRANECFTVERMARDAWTIAAAVAARS